MLEREDNVWELQSGSQAEESILDYMKKRFSYTGKQ